MLRAAIAVAATSFLAAALPCSAQYVNIAEGATVALDSGAIGGGDLSTLTDGVELPRGTGWQNGTVWWNGPTVVQIDLGGSFLLEAGSVQADDNDAYLLEYRNPDDGVWSTLWDIANYNNRIGGGMISRPDFGFTDPDEWFVFPAAVTADAVRLSAASGDNSYSLSEVRLGVVPEPTAVWMAAVAAVGVAFRRVSA